MTMKELMEKSHDELEELAKYMVLHDNPVAAVAIDYVIKFANKRVRVVKGRKCQRVRRALCFGWEAIAIRLMVTLGAFTLHTGVG